MKTIAAAVLAAVALAACATRPAIPDEASASRPFAIERDLAGKTVGRGAFKSITGADRLFTAYLDGTYEGETLTLVEDFEYDDGEKDRKTWRLTRQASGEWSGTREDVVGTARGYQDGPAFRLEYQVDIPMKNGGKRRVGFRDVLILRADGVVYNKANVGWRGFAVGGVELEIRRAPEE
ncbi:MAG: DUF3833 family protein [Parvularculaceae bacterium]|nr:DUF3833 family protein [Parvularculaceae bacterium]